MNLLDLLKAVLSAELQMLEFILRHLLWLVLLAIVNFVVREWISRKFERSKP